MVGVASITPVPGSPGGAITGTVTFTRVGPSVANVRVQMTGFKAGTDGRHGMHILTYGDLRGFLPLAGSRVSGGLSGGGHFNPDNARLHTCGNDASVFDHRGDLGNWFVRNGTIDEERAITGLNLSGVDSIIGRMVEVTANEDDCASLPDGKSGEPWAVGVIGIANVPNNDASSLARETKAVCVFQGTDNRPAALGVGFATLEAVAGSNKVEILVKARVSIGDTEQHGFHAHTYGDITSTDASSVGGHYNKHNQNHGLPNDNSNPVRHAGDFGNIRQFQDGNHYYELLVTENYNFGELLLSDFIGRSLIIHEKLDHGAGANCPPEALTNGSRYFMCVIGVMNVDPLPPNNTAAFTLEVPTIPAGMVIDKNYASTPCGDPINPGPAVPTAPVDRGLPGGVVVGILIGVIFGVAIIVGIIAFLFIKSGACSRGDSSDNYSKL